MKNSNTREELMKYLQNAENTEKIPLSAYQVYLDNPKLEVQGANLASPCQILIFLVCFAYC